MTMAHTRGIIVDMYVRMYVSLTCVCRTLVPEIRVHPEMLHLSLYIDVIHVCEDT